MALLPKELNCKRSEPVWEWRTQCILYGTVVYVTDVYMNVLGIHLKHGIIL